MKGIKFVSDTELDGHVDSPVVGKYAYILETTPNTASISEFTSNLGDPIQVQIVIAAVAYDCKYTGKTYIMVIYNTLYFNNIFINLIPPIMMRIEGLEVNECPKYLSKSPTEKDHSIFFPDSKLRLPLLIEGIISYISTMKPSRRELDGGEGDYLLLTPNLPEWDTYTTCYRDQ